MSQYQSVEVNLKDKQCLVEALKEMGFQVEIAPTNNGLRYQGYKSQNGQASVVIRKQSFKDVTKEHVSGDIGFEELENNAGIRMHIDNSDKGKFPLNKLKQIYCEKKLRKAVREDGRYMIDSRSVGKNNTIRLRLIEI